MLLSVSWTTTSYSKSFAILGASEFQIKTARFSVVLTVPLNAGTSRSKLFEYYKKKKREGGGRWKGKEKWEITTARFSVVPLNTVSNWVAKEKDKGRGERRESGEGRREGKMKGRKEGEKKRRTNLVIQNIQNSLFDILLQIRQVYHHPCSRINLRHSI